MQYSDQKLGLFVAKFALIRTKAGDAQAFWIRVRAPRDQPPGVYLGDAQAFYDYSAWITACIGSGRGSQEVSGFTRRCRANGGNARASLPPLKTADWSRR